MNYKYTLIAICLCFFNCKNDKTNEETITKELTIAEKIAHAHGFENWNNVSEVQFTFKVDRDTIKGTGRSWIWKPKTKDITLMTQTDTLSYNQTKIDSLAQRADRAFINDKFWLLFPFQLVWDKSATISEPIKATAPISAEEMNKITLLYPNEGGYTPGDAYDIYYKDDFFIREWTFRQGNSAEPSLSNTFENYQDFKGIKIAIDHKKDNGRWNLNFGDVKVSTDN